jgi:hypothetical protein
LSWYKALLGLALVLAGCGSGKGSTAPAAVEPTLANIQQQIFTPGCALPSCHSSAAQRGGLVLEAGRSYAQLVNTPAENSAARAAGKLRVVPGHPEQSFLIDKLAGPGPDEGNPMPYTGSLLPSAQIEVIRLWITRGAAEAL